VWAWAAANQVSPLRAALGFITSVCPEATVICGVTSPEQLNEVAETARMPWDCAEVFTAFAQDRTPSFDPRLW